MARSLLSYRNAFWALAAVGGLLAWRAAVTARAPLLSLLDVAIADDAVWGDSGGSDDVTSFTIPDLDVEHAAWLQARLRSAHVQLPRLSASSADYGVNASALSELLHYWAEDWSWNKSTVMQRLRGFAHYRTTIRGLDLHFAYIPARTDHPSCALTEGQRLRRVPVMLIHGWPGSVLEFLDAAPLLAGGCTLTNDASGQVLQAFDVLLPSLPGYGFSGSPTRSGCGVLATADLFLQLLQRARAAGLISGSSAYVQGGDWGSMVAVAMAQMDAARAGAGTFKAGAPRVSVAGVHINMVTSTSPFTPLHFLAHAVLPTPLRRWFVSDDDVERANMPLTAAALRAVEHTGYMHQQATRPDTLGVALTDSPAGFAAWVLEKFTSWSDLRAAGPRGALAKFGPDWLVSNIMLYVGTHHVATALRYYKESLSDSRLWRALSAGVQQPAGIIDFPKELIRNTRAAADFQFHDLVHFVTPEVGGHFGALEQPELFVTHVRAAFALITQRVPADAW